MTYGPVSRSYFLLQSLRDEVENCCCCDYSCVAELLPTVPQCRSAAAKQQQFLPGPAARTADVVEILFRRPAVIPGAVSG